MFVKLLIFFFVVYILVNELRASILPIKWSKNRISAYYVFYELINIKKKNTQLIELIDKQTVETHHTLCKFFDYYIDFNNFKLYPCLIHKLIKKHTKYAIEIK